MHGLKYEMLRAGDKLGLLFRGRSPQQEDHRLFAFVKQFYDSVGEYLPAHVPVTVGKPCPYSEHRVQKKDPVFCPGSQLTVLRDICSEIVMQLFEYVHQRRRRLYAFLHGKAETVCLSRTVIGVLSESSIPFLKTP